MALYTIYYSTRPHINEYEKYLENKDKYHQGNIPEKPATAKIIYIDVENEIKKKLNEQLAAGVITKDECREKYIEERYKNSKDKLIKYEVDAFTSMFKDEADFIQKVAGPTSISHREFLDASKNGRKNRIVVLYSTKGKSKELEPIYDNLVFQKVAIQFLRRKLKGENPTTLYLRENIKEDFDKYVSNILEYLKEEKYKKDLINVFSKTEEYNPLHKRMINVIERFYNYRSLQIEREENQDYSNNEEIKTEVDNYSNKIKKLMRDYDIFRTVALWEQNLKRRSLAEQQKRTREESLNIQKIINFDELISPKFTEEDKIKDEIIKEIYYVAKMAEEEAISKNRSVPAGVKRELVKKFNSGQLNFMSQEFLDKYRISINALEKKEIKQEKEQDKLNKSILKEYENDIIYSLYNSGGISAVIENVDLDDLVRYPRVVLEDIGINVDGLGINSGGDPINNGKRK